MPLKPSLTLNDKLLKFSELSLLCSKLLQLCKHRLIVNMMMMAKQVYKVVVILTPPMLVIVMLAKLVVVVMEVVVVAVLGAVEAVDLPQRVCRQCDDPNFAQPVHRDEDWLGKPKFTMPKFVGSTDVEEYLNWELKVGKLWRMHEYTEDKKIKLASSEFDDYALIWWDNLVQSRIEDGYPPIVTWRAMKEELRAHFVPHNYIRSLYDRLQNLKQGPLSVDDYFQEMELIL
jgi:hypothetical protein